MTTVLLTGFEPFGGDATNPSWDAVELVRDAWDREERLVVERLPVVFWRAGRRMQELIATESPDLVVAAGLAGDAQRIRIERFAVNLDDARIPDNVGEQPRDARIAADGPEAYATGLPARTIAQAIESAGIPSELSLSAGAFVCNHVFYTLRHAGAMGGFVHVPWPVAVPLADQARALRIAIDTALAERG